MCNLNNYNFFYSTGYIDMHSIINYNMINNFLESTNYTLTQVIKYLIILAIVIIILFLMLILGLHFKALYMEEPSRKRERSEDSDDFFSRYMIFSSGSDDDDDKNKNKDKGKKRKVEEPVGGPANAPVSGQESELPDKPTYFPTNKVGESSSAAANRVTESSSAAANKIGESSSTSTSGWVTPSASKLAGEINSNSFIKHPDESLKKLLKACFRGSHTQQDSRERLRSMSNDVYNASITKKRLESMTPEEAEANIKILHSLIKKTLDNLGIQRTSSSESSPFPRFPIWGTYISNLSKWREDVKKIFDFINSIRKS